MSSSSANESHDHDPQADKAVDYAKDDATHSDSDGALRQGASGTDAENGNAKVKAMPEIPITNPAVITCREDLDALITAHAQWMKSVLDPKTHVPAGRANLKGADLRPYDLSGVNLSGANLSGANLQGVELVGANLTVANLQQAQLQCANLRGAKLRGAKIEGADLRGADLTDAVLLGCDLTKAILKGPESTVKSADSVPSQEAVGTYEKSSTGDTDGTQAELGGHREL